MGDTDDDRKDHESRDDADDPIAGLTHGGTSAGLGRNRSAADPSRECPVLTAASSIATAA